MNKYQSYKSSGVEWIGDIPFNWDVRRIKYLFKSIVEKSVDGSEELLSVSEKKGIVPRRELRDENEELTRSESLEGYLKVEKDDLVNNIMLMWKRGLGFSNYKGIVSPSYSVFRLNIPNIPSYWNYLLRTDLYITEYRRNSTGVIESRLRLYDDSFGDIYSILPPLSEQNQIVQFLDEKTDLIDNLISTKERKITLLKEQRTSLINQVVSKGLNPNVNMKDSGVEWIGEIPEHWVITKFNRYVFFQEGPGLRTFQFTDEGTKVICVTNITENGIDFTYKKFISNEEYLEKYKHFTVQKGDLLLSSSGNSWGKVSEYLEDEKVILNTSTIRLNTLDSKKMNKNLIKYILKSEFVRTQLDILMTGSCQPNFGPTHLNQLIIPVPPIDEQLQIISNIEKHDFEFQKLIQLEQKKIDLLKEYRQSLISEVVTGKIKVTTDE